MAKYNSSPFGNISGEVLGVVASSNKGIKFLRNKGKVADAKTQKQLARRAIYGEFCTLWDEKVFYSAGASPRDIFIKKEPFRLCLGFCLKFSSNASLLNLAVCPDNGTMSAPVYTQTSAERKGAQGYASTGVFLFPAYSSERDFILCSAYFGENYFNNVAPGARVDFYLLGEITDRTGQLSFRVPNNDYMASIGQKTYRSFWYANKKTGQLSKPLCIACDDSGNIETFYPFGK